MDEYKSKDNFDKFYSIIHSALVSKKRVDELLKILEVIRDFEYRLHYESYETLYEIEKKLLTRDVLPLQNKTQQVEIDFNSQELALNYLAFWDTNIGQGTDKDSVLARSWFEISIQEAYTMSKAINCFSIREFISYYRINQRMYSQNEIKALNRKGIDDVRINQFSKLVIFLSAQSMAFPYEISNIIDMNSVKIKLDLSSLKLNTPETLQGIMSAFANSGNIFKRVNLS